MMETLTLKTGPGVGDPDRLTLIKHQKKRTVVKYLLHYPVPKTRVSRIVAASRQRGLYARTATLRARLSVKLAHVDKFRNGNPSPRIRVSSL
jgi:hypothetical protein